MLYIAVRSILYYNTAQKYFEEDKNKIFHKWKAKKFKYFYLLETKYILNNFKIGFSAFLVYELYIYIKID